MTNGLVGTAFAGRGDQRNRRKFGPSWPDQRPKHPENPTGNLKNKALLEGA